MALRYWVGGTDNWNATAGTKWALTSGGAGGQAVPTSADDVFLDAASGVNTVTITSTATAKSLDCTGFTGTLAGVIALNVSGSVTLSATMTQNYTGILSILALSTITSNGKSITSITIATASTITISGVLNVTNFQYPSAVATSVNGSTINISGNLATSTNTGSGTALLNMIGTGTLTGSSLANNITINTTGTITTTGFGMGAGTFTYIPNTGTFTPSGTCTFNGSTINSSGISWIGITLTNNITLTSAISISGLLTLGNSATTITGTGFLTSCGSLTTTGNVTFTLANNLTVIGDYTVASSTTFAGTYSIFIGGNLTVQATRLVISTAVTLVLDTASTATWSHASGGYIGANLIINKPLGTLILSTNVYYRTGTLTYTVGTVDTTTNNSTLNIETSCTLNTNGINWNNVVITGGTQTLTSDLYCKNFTVGGGSNNLVNSGGNIYILNNLLHNLGGSTTGTASINLIGTGTWTDTAINEIRNNLNINTIGTITIVGNVYYGLGILTHILGNVITTGSTLNITGTSTLNINGINWNNVIITNGVQTLTSNLNCQNLTVASIGSTTINNSGGDVYINGNLTNAGNAATLGTSSINLIGTGTWSQISGTTDIRNNLNINTTNTITISGNIYYSTGTLTVISGNVITTGSTLSLGAATTTKLDTKNVIWNNISPLGTNTLLSDLYFSGLFENSVASNITINDFNIYCVNGKLSGVGSGVIFSGTTNFIFKGDSSWFTVFQTFNFAINIIIDCNKITLASNNTTQFTSFYSKTLTYLKGKINENSYLNLFSSCTLINFNKCIVNNIKIATNATITMNEFFSGNPSTITNIIPSVLATNYIISFQDNFEKISKFVNISGCTLTRPLQLLVITNSKKSSTNTRGIRYINQNPNGIAKNEPSTLVQNTYGTQMLLNDPAMK